MVHFLIQTNFPTVFVIGLMLILLFTNKYFSKELSVYFWIATVVLTIIVVAEIIDYCTTTFAHPTMLRLIASIVGYSLRPVLIAVVLCMGIVKWWRNIAIIFIPVFINLCIQLSALFCGIAFSYDENNNFVRGPLGYSAHIVSAFLLVLLVIATYRKYHNLSVFEPLLAVFAGALVLFATFLESAFDYYGIINVTAGVSIVYYYLYLNIQQYKRDGLTNALNRKCLSVDSKRNANNIAAVILLDLNDLKKINDKSGHDAGDRAIVTVVSCIRRSLIKGCSVYRIGGDEFIILCCKRKKHDIELMLKNISRRIEETPYRCAMGLVFSDDNSTFDELCVAADKEMYLNKRDMKERRRDIYE